MFEYGIDKVSDSYKATFADCANLLLAAVDSRLGGNRGEVGRPIIFVGYSTGGIVIKQGGWVWAWVWVF